MATKTENIGLELAHFNNFKQHIPEYETLCIVTMNKLLDMGLVQVSTAFEHALANVGGFEVVSIDGCDGSDGSDAKLCSVRFRANQTAYSACVSGTKNKIGKLRVQVYERMTNKFYFFVIPNEAYCNITYVEIPFKLDGSPNRNSKWWKHEVNTFVELSKI